jgi:hypothetical protein
VEGMPQWQPEFRKLFEDIRQTVSSEGVGGSR